MSNSKFKVKIGAIFEDNNRNLTVIDKEYIKSTSGHGQTLKYYTCICNKCGYKNKVLESNLIQKKRGCPACRKSPQVVVLGINTIWDTDRWMCDLGLSEEDAKTHTKCSNDKVEVKCPDCDKTKQIIISNLYKTHSIGCQCNDKKSYISKYMFNLLEQLKVDFEVENKFDWCKFYNPFKKKDTFGIYDFILENNKLIIETDGGFHRKDNKMRNQTKEESEWLDKIKDKLAKEYEYKVVRISDEGDIKQNILNSILDKLFDLSKIDWDLCILWAMKNMVKEVCNYWNHKPYDMNAEQVGNVFKLSRPTIVKYLKQGEKFNWCRYDSNEEKIKGRLRGNKNRKEIEIFDLNKNKLRTFESARDLERQSEELFGIKMLNACISKACNNKTPYKGYLFNFTNCKEGEINHEDL